MDNSQIAAMIAEAVAAAFAATNAATNNGAGTTDTNDVAPIDARSFVHTGEYAGGKKVFAVRVLPGDKIGDVVNVPRRHRKDARVTLASEPERWLSGSGMAYAIVRQWSNTDGAKATTPAATTPAATSPTANPFIPVSPVTGNREDVRRWAMANGHAVYPRGAIKREVVEAYNAAHGVSAPTVTSPTVTSPTVTSPTVTSPATSSVASAEWVTVQLAPDVTVRVTVGQIAETRARWPEMMIVGYGG